MTMGAYDENDLFHYASAKYAERMGRREQDDAQKPERPAVTRALHQHSLDAHEATAETMQGRKRAILEWLRAYGPATDRQVKDAVVGDRADMNSVRPRITELIGLGLAHEVGSIKDDVTGLHVRIVRARMEGELA